MTARVHRFAAAAALLAAAFAAPTVVHDIAGATAPSAALCNGNNAFCGYALHVKNGSTSVLPSKSIGAHYGAGWSIPASSNNSAGIGFCLNDQFFGVPIGPVVERPLAPGWTTAQMSTAAYILTNFAGDRVSPYQPIAIESNGEFPGFTTRQRYAAVHLALLSVVPNFAGGSTYSPLIDPTTMQLFNDVGGTIPSAQQVLAPLVQDIVAAANDHHADGSPVVLTATNAAGVVTVTATKDGLPVADLPIWPDTISGVTYSGATTSQAHLNAQLMGWPSLDYSSTLAGAGVTDATGEARFTVTRAALAGGLRFRTEEPPGQLHSFGDGINSQDNLTWLSGDIRRPSTRLISLPTAFIGTQISNGSPVVGESLSDVVLLFALDPGVTAEVQLQLFDLTLDPDGTGTPLVDVTVDGLGNGTTPDLAPWTVTVAQAGHTLGYRERLLTTSDGMTVAPFEWSVLGIASETATMQGLVTAETHLRKTVSGDGTTWFNAQAGSGPSYGPAAAPADPAGGSHDDGAPDQGDAVPVFADGTQVSFRYEVWLDPTSTGVVQFGNGTTDVVTDDNGTAVDTDDDFHPGYTSGDDGDGVLELGETWVYTASDARVATAGETYRNHSAIPSGDVHRSTNLTGPSEGTTTPRRDPAGYVVPSLQTSVGAAVDGGRTISPDGGTMVDTITYTNLVPGQTVTIAGELQRRTDDGAVAPTAITGTATITPTDPEGTAEVTFIVPAGSDPGTYVVFETLTFDGIVVAEHSDPDDQDQTFVKRSPIEVTTEACHSQVITVNAEPTGMTCDRITVRGDPGDVVTGTSTAYRWIGGSRDCATPGAVAEWTVTVGPNGVGTGDTEMVAVPVGPSWEWIESATSQDGRRFFRNCATSPQDARESFVMRRGGGGGNDFPHAGADTVLAARVGATALAAGAAALSLSRRRRRRVCR